MTPLCIKKVIQSTEEALQKAEKHVMTREIELIVKVRESKPVSGTLACRDKRISNASVISPVPSVAPRLCSLLSEVSGHGAVHITWRFFGGELVDTEHSFVQNF